MKLLEQIVSISFYSGGILLLFWIRYLWKEINKISLDILVMIPPPIAMFFTCIAYDLLNKLSFARDMGHVENRIGK